VVSIASLAAVAVALSIYAAVVATAGFAWQVYKWRRRRRPDLLVIVRQMLLMGGPGDDPYTPAEPGGPIHRRVAVEVLAVNRGEVSVAVDSLGLWAPQSSTSIDASWPGGTHRQLAPGESLRETFELTPDDTDVLEGFLGFAELVSGERFTSGPPDTMDRTLMKFADW
jgi:hypothetical protein